MSAATLLRAFGLMVALLGAGLLGFVLATPGDQHLASLLAGALMGVGLGLAE